MIRIQKPGLGTIVGEGTLASMTFRAAGLSQAFQTSREEDGHLTCLPIDHLWESYSPSDDIVTEVRQHLIDKRWLSEKGKWNGIDGEKIDKKHFAAWSKGANEVKAFAFFSRLFNAVLEYLRQSGRGTSIEKMVQVAGAESTGFGGHRPNAILHVVVKPPLASSRFKWRDLTCPFEYKLRKGDAVDVGQPESITAFQDRVLTLNRTAPRHCGTSIISCAVILVECSRSGPPFRGQCSVSGCSAGRHPSHLPLLTGLRLALLLCVHRWDI